ncbi:MAG TPA: DUF445 domain-containing protein, partial [Nevskiales bacterium]|nr:DUF445 domain-containing protein [Nevskiales bacterium]
FEPLEFVGLNIRLFGYRLFGWQGIVPRKAADMAAIACDTMTRRLLSPQDVFAKLDPARVAREIEKPLLAAVDEITREVAAQIAPGLWEAAPERLRQLVINRIKADAPSYIQQIMLDMKNNIDNIFDLKQMVIGNLLRDKRLLNRIFREIGDKEFQFIARSGIPFGFAIGCVQAVTWALTHNPWVMPLFGAFTGWFTDWLALKMIFRPKRPTRYLGLFEWQGLFLKRRREVAAEYGALIASEIVTPRNVLEAVLRGPLSDRLYAMVQKNVQRMVDEQAGLTRPIVVMAVGSAKFQAMKKLIADKLMERLPETLAHAEKYAADAMDLENTLRAKMQELNEDEFEQLIRPAFQQDEWILIAVGATLGFLVGELQVFVMLHLGH